MGEKVEQIKQGDMTITLIPPGGTIPSTGLPPTAQAPKKADTEPADPIARIKWRLKNTPLASHEVKMVRDCLLDLVAELEKPSAPPAPAPAPEK